MADLKFGDREYRKVDGIWMMHPSTLPGFIAVAEESTIAMLDAIERLRAAGRSLARHVDESGYGTDLERSLIAAWQEAAHG